MKRAAIAITVLMTIAGAAAVYAQPTSPLSSILAQLDTLIAKVEALDTAVNAQHGALIAKVEALNTAVNAQHGALIAKLEALETAVKELAPKPQTTTTLLFPFTSNQFGFDTGIVIANTGDTSGSCTIHFIGTKPPAAAVVATIAAGQTFTTNLTTVAPGFQGFIRANCGFPMARGYGVLSDAGLRTFAASVPAEVVQ